MFQNPLVFICPIWRTICYLAVCYIIPLSYRYPAVVLSMESNLVIAWNLLSLYYLKINNETMSDWYCLPYMQRNIQGLKYFIYCVTYSLFFWTELCFQNVLWCGKFCGPLSSIHCLTNSLCRYLFCSAVFAMRKPYLIHHLLNISYVVLAYPNLMHCICHFFVCSLTCPHFLI